MSGYLLDTSVISELRKRKPHGAVLAWLRGVRPEQLFVSAASFGELQSGAERTRQNDAAKADEIEAWINEIVGSSQIVPMDAACFREHARLMRDRPDDLYEDAMIAATARVHGFVVATRNERDFAKLDVRIVNPFRS
jgi:predicted nucleic acid-binding protein